MTKDFDLNATESADQINFILVRSNVTMSQTAIFKQVQMKHLSFQVENIKCIYIRVVYIWCVYGCYVVCGNAIEFSGRHGWCHGKAMACRAFSLNV